MKESKEPQIVEAEDGEGFQEYIYEKNNKRVKAGTPVGVEAFNPRTKEWELHLFRDINFRSD